MLVCISAFFPAGTPSPTDAGRDVFNGLIAAAFLLCAAACLLSSDAIGIERREGTLALLLLTHVRGLDLLLGRLGSAALTGLCATAAFLPVLMIPVLAGGVTGGEAFRKGLALLNTLFFALALGLRASSTAREQWKAARNAVLMTGFFILIPWLAWEVGFPSWIVGLFSPLVTIICAGETRFQTE